MTNTLTIANTPIREMDGLFSLSDLHLAAGGAERHKPHRFMRLETTKALAGQIEHEGHSPKSGSGQRPEMVSGETPEMVSGVFKIIKGSVNPGTWACRELVIAYAAWISAAFHLKVIRVFLGTVAPQVAVPALPAPVEMATVPAHNLRALIQFARLTHQTVFREGLYEALDKLGASHFAARLYGIAQDGNFCASLVEREAQSLHKPAPTAQKTQNLQRA